MLLLKHHLNRMVRDINSAVAADGGIVLAPDKGFNAKNARQLIELLPDTYMTMPISSSDSGEGDKEKIQLLIVANNPASLWLCWNRFLDRFPPKNDSVYERNAAKYPEFTPEFYDLHAQINKHVLSFIKDNFPEIQLENYDGLARLKIRLKLA